jgi:hypothetical protein
VASEGELGSMDFYQATRRHIADHSSTLQEEMNVALLLETRTTDSAGNTGHQDICLATGLARSSGKNWSSTFLSDDTDRIEDQQSRRGHTAR